MRLIVRPSRRTVVMSPSKIAVLVVDDDDGLRKMICRALEAHYTVFQAADAKSALELLKTIAVPDAIVCDIMMPAMTGIDLAKVVRATSRLQHVPIIFLTALSGPMDVINAINAGARSYMTKPFKMEALVQRIAKIVGGP